MSATKPPIPTFELDEELVQKISGGSCTASEIGELMENLKENYDALVDFTSYVIERVVNGTTN